MAYFVFQSFFESANDNDWLKKPRIYKYVFFLNLIQEHLGLHAYKTWSQWVNVFSTNGIFSTFMSKLYKNKSF